VPRENLLGEVEGKGFGNAMMTLDRARPGVAAQALGLAQGALEWAMRYTAERQQFGQSVMSFQGIQFKLADMATEIEAARQLVYAAARAIDAGHPGASKYAAMCKVYASDVAMRVTAATATAGTTRSRSTCATPRSPRSTRARTRSSAW
jgi:alkylation response protein AidB-like acyl-CoA dehydrogenase